MDNFVASNPYSMVLNLDVIDFRNINTSEKYSIRCALLDAFVILPTFEILFDVVSMMTPHQQKLKF